MMIMTVFSIVVGLSALNILGFIPFGLTLVSILTVVFGSTVLFDIYKSLRNRNSKQIKRSVNHENVIFVLSIIIMVLSAVNFLSFSELTTALSYTVAVISIPLVVAMYTFLSKSKRGDNLRNFFHISN